MFLFWSFNVDLTVVLDFLIFYFNVIFLYYQYKYVYDYVNHLPDPI